MVFEVRKGEIKMRYKGNRTIEKVLGDRSVFTYHHDLQRMTELCGCSRGHVAQILRKKYPDEEKYMEQVTYGAIKYAFERLAEDVTRELFTIEDENEAVKEFFELKRLYKKANNKVEMFTESDGCLLVDHF
jgi:hypothetical protein